MKKREIKDNYFCKLTIDIYPYKIFNEKGLTIIIESILHYKNN